MRGGAAPAIYRDRESPDPSSEFLAQTWACSGHPGRWSPLFFLFPSPPLSSPTPTLCVIRIPKGCSILSLLEEVRAKQKALVGSGGKCDLGLPPHLTLVQGLSLLGEGTPWALGLYPHPDFAGLPAGVTFLIPGLLSHLWKWLAPNASLVPPLPATAWQTPPASIERCHQGLPAGQT